VNRRTTIRDIAQKAGCHYSTVSLALRNEVEIGEKTRGKIQRLAREMGYCPDPMLRALAAYRTMNKPAHYHATLAWLTNANEPLSHTSRKYLRGAQARAEQLGYKIEEFRVCGPDMRPERLPRILRARAISGLLVPPQPSPNRTQAEIRMDWSSLSAVAFGYSLAWPSLHLVVNNQHRSAKLAVQKLAEMGHRRIGLVVDDVANERTDGNWSGGYMAEVIRRQLAPQIFFRRSGDSMTLLSAEEAPRLKAWLKKNKPEALIIDYSPPFIDWLRRTCGLRVPEDISVVSLNVDHPSYSGIDQNEHEGGVAAVDFLVQLLHTNERGIPAIPRRLLIEGTWCDGKTVCAAVPKGGSRKKQLTTK